MLLAASPGWAGGPRLQDHLTLLCSVSFLQKQYAPSVFVELGSN